MIEESADGSAIYRWLFITNEAHSDAHGGPLIQEAAWRNAWAISSRLDFSYLVAEVAGEFRTSSSAVQLLSGTAQHRREIKKMRR